MVSMYPHKLYIVSVGSSRDSNGYVVSATESERLVGACRLETSGRGNRHYREDGTYVDCSHTIYCPTSVEAIASRSIVKVIDSNGNVLLKGEIVNCIKSQLHVRLWV